MTPVEHYYAMQAYGKVRESEIQGTYSAARTGAWLVVNHIPFMKRRYRKPTDLLKLPWEKEAEQRYQTIDEMKRAMYAIAAAGKGNKEFKSRKDLKR